MVESCGYDARFLAEPVLNRMADFAPEVGLLLLAPALSIEGRKALFDAMAAMPEVEKVPVLELVPVAGGSRKGGQRTLTWPCGSRQLGRAIDDALSAGSLTESA